MRTYWWRRQPNFGDQLGPLLLNHYGVPTDWDVPRNAQVVTVGSILEHLPPDYDGTILGSGFLFEPKWYPLRRAKVRALRGEYTAAVVRPGESLPLGDPGLLAPSLITKPKADINVGWLPHWSESQRQIRGAVRIDPSADARAVITAIASCTMLMTSSLHGVVVADAFGVPRVAMLPATAPREGNGFKFLDYASGVGYEMKFGEVQRPPRRKIRAAQKRLGDAFSAFAAGAIP